MLRIDKRRCAAGLLRLCYDMQGDGRLTGRFRAIDLDDPAPGNAAYPQGQIQGQAAGRYGGYADLGSRIPQLHNGALAKLFFYLA